MLYEVLCCRILNPTYTHIICDWAHNIRLHIAGTNEPKSAQQAKQGT